MGILLAITPWPAISALLWFVLAVAVLYLARHTAHQAIHTDGCRARARPAHSCAFGRRAARAKLATRNREVLLAAGREAKERIVEREFVRVGESVRKDLANYPALHRALSESIKRIEENHQNAVDVPPEAPGWVRAVEAVAKIDARKGGTDVLDDIHKSLVKAHKEAMEAYRDRQRRAPRAAAQDDARVARRPGNARPRQQIRREHARRAPSRSTGTCRSTRTSCAARIARCRRCRRRRWCSSSSRRWC